MTTTQAVKTAKVTDRRVLHFNTLDEILVDANSMADADRAGKLRCLGNWSYGQNLGHLASWVNYSFDGVPLKVPGIVRIVLRTFMKNSALHKPMRPGSNIPRVPGGTLGTASLSTDQGLAELTKAYARLKAGPPASPHLLFGPLTHQEWMDQHLRHAELHLSFVRAD